MKLKVMALLVLMSLIVSFPVAQAGSGTTPSGIPLAEVESFVDQFIEAHIGQTTPGAAVVLVKDGEIILSKGYGYADIDNEIKVDPANTVFEYGSVSKLFVYTTIMQLVEQGQIDLETDIREFLPAGFLKKLNSDKPITMLNIMNHTAGFEDYLFDVILTTSDSLHSLEKALQEFQPEQVYEPGTVTAYSNYGVALAAYIAEGFLGQDFYEYLMDSVFIPLGMETTSAHITLADKPELLDSKATAYFPGRDGFSPGPWSYVVPYPAGSVTGTAEDLARFALALLPADGEVGPLFANRSTLDDMFSQTHSLGPGLTGFAHGFIEWDGSEYYTLGHGGNTAAFSAQVNIVPVENFGVVILTNSAGESEINLGLTQALLGKRNQPAPSSPGNLPSAREVEGSYISARRMHNSFLELYAYLSLVDVRAVEDNVIELSMGGQSATLVQTSPYVFERGDAEGFLNYIFDTVYFEVVDGRVQRMSGDLLPLPAGRTRPWLMASILVAGFTLLYFSVSPVVLLIGKLRRKRRTSYETLSWRRYMGLLTLTGIAVLANNALLIGRMLIDNYRSFAEVRIHILINYPLFVLAAVLIIATILQWRRSRLSPGQKIWTLTTIFTLLAFAGLLVNWQFLTLLT